MKTYRHLYILNIFLVTLFILCLFIGFKQAKDKPLWTDEIYTQIYSIRSLSYREMLLGKIDEGNNSPLFYILQKGICNILHYKLPPECLPRSSQFKDIQSQLILRLSPVLFMTLTVVSIFYYFSRYYSRVAGIYSVLIALSSYMILAYWAEARPYALWVFLTTIQSLIFLHLFRTKGGSKHAWGWLIFTHVLLCLTSSLGIIQISTVSLILFIGLNKDWKKYVALWLVPLIVCSFYFYNAPKYKFFFVDGPLSLINSSIPKDRLLFLLTFACYFFFRWVRSKKTVIKLSADASLTKEGLNESGVYLGFLALMLIGYSLLLMMFKITEGLPHEGFQISNRYFISLTPVGIIAMTLFSINLVESSRNKIIKTGICVVLLILLFIRFQRTFTLCSIG